MDLVKMEPEDDHFGLLSHDITHIIKENKASSQEGNLSHLEAMGMKTEYVDHNYDIKTEIKIEDTPVPVSFRMLKTEVDEDLFNVGRVQQEQKVEVSSKENEVFPERCKKSSPKSCHVLLVYAGHPSSSVDNLNVITH
ncbi:uncharacterized protein [Periplaneta americana]|uniref:uncharacterized protein isoform X5 n=1 Tax=Periplaneta americana TaxID=6978 RepID=UPI0037E83739